jgi:hypothetical protein
MTEKTPSTVRERLLDRPRIVRAVQRAVREALLTHARAGNPVCEWRDGRVVWVTPEEIFARFAPELSPAPASHE